MTAADRQALIKSHLRLAAHLTSKVTFTRNPNDVRWQDTYGDACEALCEAADAFDPERGITFLTFAYHYVLNAIRRTAIRDTRHSKTHVVVRSHAGVHTEDSADYGLELAEARAGVAAPSPEALYIAAEEAAVGQARLDRLPPEDRERMEGLLAGQPVRGKVMAEQVAARAGVRIASGDRVPPAGTMDGATRAARWFARMSPEARERRNAGKRARCAAARAARLMAKAA